MSMYSLLGWKIMFEEKDLNTFDNIVKRYLKENNIDIDLPDIEEDTEEYCDEFLKILENIDFNFMCHYIFHEDPDMDGIFIGYFIKSKLNFTKITMSQSMEYQDKMKNCLSDNNHVFTYLKKEFEEPTFIFEFVPD